MTRSDGELLAAHLADDRDAFHELAQRHLRLLWSVALRTLDDREDAAEAVQDALLRAHQGAASFRQDCPMGAWLVRILLNTCRDRHRRNLTRPAEATESEVLARVPAPRDPIADHELRLDVRDALGQLPLEQRKVLVLVHLHGYSVAEVASILQVSVGTVKSRGNRGRARLAEVLRAPSELLTAGEEA